MTVSEDIEASVHPDNSDISATHHSAMFSFKLLTTSPQAVTTGARLGQLITRAGKIQTPNFIAPSSRGVVPHLSQDNLRDHTKIPGVYVATEDCMFPLCWRAQLLRLPSYPAYPIANLQPNSSYRKTPPLNL